MLTQDSTSQMRLKELENLFSSLKISDPQGAYRDKAWDRFLELGLPDKKVDAYQYVPLRALYENTFIKADEIVPNEEAILSAIYPECKDSCLVFVNGQYSKELSRTSALPKQMIVLSLQEAFRSYGSFLQGRFAKSVKEEMDPFASLNLSLFQKGLFLLVPPKMEVAVPVQCLHIAQGKEEGLSLLSPRVHLYMGRGAKMSLISTIHALSDAPFINNSLIDAVLEEGAEFHSMHLSCSLPASAFDFEAVRAVQKRDSTFHSLSVSEGAKSVRQDFRVALTEENSSTELQGINLLRGKSQAHSQITVDHLAPHTRSMQRFKGVLRDISQSSFQGKIHVAREAQKTDAYQRNNNLILGERAIANSKPSLQIFADDVKASHGATIAQLDPSHLFYLKARGLSEAQAKSLLVLGFCQELIADIPFASIKNELLALSQSYPRDVEE